MRIALVYDGFPWPPRSGDNTRVGQMIQVLRSHGHEVWLVCTTLPAPRCLQLSRDKVDHVLFYYPRTLRNGLRLSKRWLDGWLARLRLPMVEDILLRLLKRGAGFAEIADYWLRFPAGLDGFLADLTEREGIGLVIVEYVWLHRAVDALPAGVRTMIDVHDLQYRRVEEFRKIGKRFPLAIDREREMRIYDRFGAAIAIQQAEAEELMDSLRSADVVTTGVAFYDPLPMPDNDRPKVLFLGGFNEANKHGLLRFVAEVWPIVIRACPESRLRVGGHICRALQFKAIDPTVELLGFVQDARTTYVDSDLVVNPVWVGTGLKIKTVEALGHARPLVTTSVGVQGMVPDPGRCCLVRDDPAQMAEALVGLIRSRDERAGLSAKAERYAHSNLSWDNVYSGLVDWIEAPGGEP